MTPVLIVLAAVALTAAGAWLVTHLRRVAARLEAGADRALNRQDPNIEAQLEEQAQAVADAFLRHVDQALALACDPDSPTYDAVIEADQNRARCIRAAELTQLEASWRLPARRPATHGRTDS